MKGLGLESDDSRTGQSTERQTQRERRSKAIKSPLDEQMSLAVVVKQKCSVLPVSVHDRLKERLHHQYRGLVVHDSSH